MIINSLNDLPISFKIVRMALSVTMTCKKQRNKTQLQKRCGKSNDSKNDPQKGHIRVRIYKSI